MSSSTSAIVKPKTNPPTLYSMHEMARVRAAKAIQFRIRRFLGRLSQKVRLEALEMMHEEEEGSEDKDDDEVILNLES